MQVLFVLRFYHPDKTDNINRLTHDSGSKMAVKIGSLVKKADVLPLAIFTLFGSVVKKRFGSYIKVSGIRYDRKNLSPLWII